MSLHSIFERRNTKFAGFGQDCILHNKHKKKLNLDTMSGANPVSDYSKIVKNERYFDHLQYIYSQFLILETKATFGWWVVMPV